MCRLRIEVLGALKFSEQFAPAGKRAKLYLWSGDTTPFAAALAATRAAGVRNMNGGDSRFDSEYPSVAYVPPLQVHQLSNESSEPFGFFCIVDHQRDKPQRP